LVREVGAISKFYSNIYIYKKIIKRKERYLNSKDKNIQEMENNEPASNV
jgi:hypothetical protein